MKIYIVIPAHNEADYIDSALSSLVQQTHLPHKIVVVNDQSTDDTAKTVTKFTEKYPIISLLNINSSDAHLPGSKVVNAFYRGLETLDDEYDLICKFDADLIFPQNYLETIVKYFKADPQVGMAGGFCYIERNEKWELENLTNKDHLRGALKTYRRDCFKQIGGLKPSMGWDTVDELLAQFHGWKIVTDDTLKVKHLRPTGFTYDKTAKLKQGEAFYKMRYGLLITLIASGKLAFKKGRSGLLKEYLQGFLHAKKNKSPYLVTKKEGAFIRRLRYKNMIKKFF